ncbi:hypothetical protein [Caldicellulosiruptor kronotskyensis]|uniref:hypothetical protein n=1 Tax=Caldicellulosiruptor kronotskyensis TaxID=413889 RepID=UPI0002F0EF78|nr:hypothetical protein [Caldicellulosiruptor kronotskyensis]
MSELLIDFIKMSKEKHSQKCLKDPCKNTLDYRMLCYDCINRGNFPRKNNWKVKDYNCQNMIYY